MYNYKKNIAFLKDIDITNFHPNPSREIHDLWAGAPILSEVASPSALRGDLLAVTLMDEEGSTYLFPTTEHDFAASVAMYDTGLQEGEVVYDSANQAVAVKYSGEADLVSFPAVLNATMGVEDAVTDVEDAFVVYGQLIAATKRELDVTPAGMTIDGFAIDRTSNTAVLLPPFQISHELSEAESMQQLYENAMVRAQTLEEQQTIQRGWHTALLRLGAK